MSGATTRHVMSIAIGRSDEHADRWQRWQHSYAESSRKTASRARVALAIMLTATLAWLAVQLFSSAWN